MRLVLHRYATGEARGVAAVYVDGQWHYADPVRPFPFGNVAPFVSARTFVVPDLPEPQQVAYAKALKDYEQHLKLSSDLLAKQIEFIDAQLAAFSPPTTEQEQITVVITKRTSPVPYIVAAVALGVALWALYQARRTKQIN